MEESKNSCERIHSCFPHLEVRDTESAVYLTAMETETLLVMGLEHGYSVSRGGCIVYIIQPAVGPWVRLVYTNTGRQLEGDCMYMYCMYKTH